MSPTLAGQESYHLGRNQGDRSKPKGGECDNQLELKGPEQKVRGCDGGITSAQPPGNKQEGSSSNTKDQQKWQQHQPSCSAGNAPGLHSPLSSRLHSVAISSKNLSFKT